MQLSSGVRLWLTVAVIVSVCHLAVAKRGGRRGRNRKQRGQSDLAPSNAQPGIGQGAAPPPFKAKGAGIGQGAAPPPFKAKGAGIGQGAAPPPFRQKGPGIGLDIGPPPFRQKGSGGIGVGVAPPPFKPKHPVLGEGATPPPFRPKEPKLGSAPTPPPFMYKEPATGTAATPPAPPKLVTIAPPPMFTNLPDVKSTVEHVVVYPDIVFGQPPFVYDDLLYRTVAEAKDDPRIEISPPESDFGQENKDIRIMVAVKDVKDYNARFGIGSSAKISISGNPDWYSPNYMCTAMDKHGTFVALSAFNKSVQTSNLIYETWANQGCKTVVSLYDEGIEKTKSNNCPSLRA